MIESNYTNYIHHGGKLKFKDFYYKSHLYNNALREKLKYDKLIGLYFDYFKPENVHILIFEKVFNSDKLQLKELDDFLNVKTVVNYNNKGINKKLSKRFISILRLFNCVLAKDFDFQYRNRLQGKQSFTEKFRWYLIRFFKEIELLKILPSSKKKYDFLDSNQINEIENDFVDSNSKLAKLLKLDLRKFGYKY